MRKSLLTLGALVVAMSANAQFIQNVGDGASVTIQTNSLLYNGGGVKVVGTGVVKNSGNVMIVGGATSKYSTVTTAGADKTDGGNFILVMTDTTSGNYRYGQLYIEGLTQDRITGIVDKQYKDDTHGTYQQMALPFYQKKFSELNDEFGKTFSNTRWTQDEILVNNNKAVRADHFTSLSTQTTADATSTVAGRNANTAYYMIGAKGLDLSTVKTIKGVPYAEGITETLQDAGKDINFAGGYARNVYKERYRTYLQDQFAATAWAGDYGRNIYQFGNPFLTNLELSYLKTAIPTIQAVRVAPVGVVSTAKGGTTSTSATYITYTSTGVAAGDVTSIIKPMQTFVLKLNSNDSAQTLSLDGLRRFAYSAAASSNRTVTGHIVTASSSAKVVAQAKTLSKSAASVSSSSSVKQLGVIALDAEGNELGRTYYVVYADAVTGKPEEYTTQVRTESAYIHTAEESVSGGADTAANDKMYINEANEKDFKGKKIDLVLNGDVKALKFEIRENVALLEEGQKALTSGESFYIKNGNDVVELAQGGKLNVASQELGLFYGRPVNETLATETINKVASTTSVVYNPSNTSYEVHFAADWNKASVKVYDLSGKLVLAKENVNTNNPLVLDLPQVKTTYVVTAVSEKGQKVTEKVIKR